MFFIKATDNPQMHPIFPPKCTAELEFGTDAHVCKVAGPLCYKMLWWFSMIICHSV